MKTSSLMLSLLLPVSVFGALSMHASSVAAQGPLALANTGQSASAPRSEPAKVAKPVVVGTVKAGAVKKPKKQAAKPCYARPVQLVRVRGEVVEPREVSLTMCNGSPNPSALDSVSVLARPRDVERPLMPEIRAYRALPVQKTPAQKGKVSAKNKKKYRDPLFVSERVLRVNPGLLGRLQKVANHYPGKIIEIISGYRPDSRDTSRHHVGRALDLRVAGITRERLRDYLRTFDETGVGYYPNSYFVHMDVRDDKAYWVDRSGPGEPADYGPWPARKQDVEHAREAVLKGALADLAELGKPSAPRDKRTAMAQPSTARVTVHQPEQERDDMSAKEAAEVRAEARRALEQM